MIPPNALGASEIEPIPDRKGQLGEVLKVSLVIAVSIGSAAILGVEAGLEALRNRFHASNDGDISNGSHLISRDNIRGDI